MPQKTISLSSKEELNIYMSPQRQQLLRVMRIQGKPITAKSLADKLNISASSAAHHILKLIKLGVIEEDHTELINGILARYYRLADVTVNIGQQIDDGLTGERTAIIQNMLLSTLKGMNEGLERAKLAGIPSGQLHEYGDFLSGVVHLSTEDAEQLMKFLHDCIESRKTPSDDTQPWEYALILYNSRSAL